MPYRIYYSDPTSSTGHNSGLINDTVLGEVVKGQGRSFVQLEGRTGEVYVAVSNIFKIEKGDPASERPAAMRLG
jgi:hypothetical protein